MRRIEAPTVQDDNDRFRPINKMVYGYFRGIEAVSEFEIPHPAVKTVKIFGDHTPGNEHRYAGIRLVFRSAEEEAKSPTYVFTIYNADGTAFVYPSPDLLRARKRTPEGARPDEASYGFLMTILKSLREEHPSVFQDPKPLIDQYMDTTHTLAS